MAETVNQETSTAEQQTFTQDELNKIVGERLARERDKYSDYDELKKKAAAFDEAQEAQKSELQKAQDRALALEAELNGLKKRDEVRTVRETVATETGVPASLLTGSEKSAATKSLQNPGSLRQTATTVYSLFCNSTAMAFPKPLEAPVTTAIFIISRFRIFFSTRK